MSLPTRTPTPQFRGEATRAAILQAARQCFAASGFDRATVRAIAAEAGVDAALVIRYFGSKAELFSLAAEFDLRIPNLSHIPRSEVGKALVRHFLTRWEEDEGLQALLRSAVTQQGASDTMRKLFAVQVRPAIERLCGDTPARSEIRAGLISSQLIGLATCRYLLKIRPLVELELTELVDAVGGAIDMYLNLPLRVHD